MTLSFPSCLFRVCVFFFRAGASNRFRENTSVQGILAYMSQGFVSTDENMSLLSFEIKIQLFLFFNPRFLVLCWQF